MKNRRAVAIARTSSPLPIFRISLSWLLLSMKRTLFKLFSMLACKYTGVKNFREVISIFRRLTLAELPWVYFDDSSRKKQRADELIKIVSDVTEKAKETTSDSRVEIGRSSYQSTIRRHGINN